MKSIPAYTDPELVRLLLEKDPEACNFLFEKYGGALYGLVYNIVPVAAVTETLSESFIGIIRSVGNYDPAKGKIFTWMMQQTRDTAIRKLKALSNRIYAGTDLQTGRDNSLGRLAADLGPEDKKIVQLAYYKGYTVDEIADEMDIPIRHVQQKMNEALVAINSHL